jgi:hypothetical protein
VESILNSAKDRMASLPFGSAEAAAVRTEIDGPIERWAALWLKYKGLMDRA